MRKHLLTLFGLRLGSYVLVVIFKTVFQFSFCLSFFVGFAERIQSMETVKLWSSTVLRLHKSINLSVLNSKKVAFFMHESQKVAPNLFTIRTYFKLYSSLLKFIYYFFLAACGTNLLCLRVTACISYRVMCFRFGQCSSLKRSILESLFFKPKMDLISTITVFGFLEIQSNDVPVDDKPSARCILNQINKTYTCTCLGYEFCF